MSIRKRIFQTIAFASLFIILLGGGIAFSVSANNIRNIEILDIQSEIVHLYNTLENERNNIVSLTGDWASWDDTYQFIIDQNEAYKDSNLVDSTFNELGLNIIIFFDVHGNVKYQKAYDLTSQQEIPVPAGVIAFINENSQIISSSKKETISGFSAMGDIPILFSINPILTSLDTGPSRGSLMFVKFIQGDILNRIRTSVDATLSILPYSQSAIPEESESVFLDNVGKNIFIMRNSNDPLIRYYATIDDVSLKNIYVLQLVKERTTYQQGLKDIKFLIFLIVFSCCATCWLVVYTLDKNLLSRLSTLNNKVKKFRQKQNLNDSLVLSGNDELASLSTEIDQTFHALAEVQKNLGDHLDFEKIMVETSTSFINLPAKNLDQGIQHALEEIGSLLNVDRCRVLIFHEYDVKVLNHNHEWCREGIPPLIDEFKNLNIRDFIWLFEMLKKGQPVIIEQGDDLPKRAKAERSFLFKNKIIATIAVPLIVHGSPIGTIAFEIIDPKRKWHPQSPIMIEIFGNIISNAIDRIRIERELGASQQFQYRLNQITKASIEKNSFHSSVRTMSMKLKSLINSDKVFLVLSDRYYPFLVYHSGQLMNLNEDIIGCINFILKMTSKKVFTMDDSQGEQNPDLGMIGRSFLAIPLIANNQHIGLAILANEKPHTFSQPEVEICEQAASQITLAIMKIRALEGAQRTSREFKSLRKAVADINAELKISNLQQIILDKAIKLLNADGGVICRYHPKEQELEVVASSHMAKDYTGVRINERDGAAGKSIQLKKTITIKDYAHWSNRLEVFRDTDIRSTIAAPLMVAERIMGSISIMQTDPNKVFTDNDQHMLNIFSQHASIAMDNAMLFATIEQMARVDEVTGLLNRRALYEIGAYEVVRARRLKRSIAAAMVDLDHYKLVNDTCSHLIGDKVLKEVARLVRENVRNIDIVGRFGGDEMIIIMPETDLQNAINTIERIRTLLEDTTIKVDEYEFNITASFGISSFEDDPPLLDEIIEQTDKAMYAAKDAGRNCVRIFQQLK